MFDWKLNDNQFSLVDRLKIAAFFLNPKKFWSQGSEVLSFEKRMAQFIGSRYAVFCSSGSTANTMVAMHASDSRISKKEKNIVVVPTIGWQTTFSPFIREGFELKFIDISLSDFSMDLSLLEKYLAENAGKVALVFVVSLLGFTPDLDRLKSISEKYNVQIKLDNCEHTFGYKVDDGSSRVFSSSLFTSTTSFYMGHNVQACGEGGMIFTNKLREYEYYLMARNHGMTRSVAHLYPNPKDNIYLNKDVDPRFDFYLLGNNFRGTDVSAFVAGLDMNRAEYYIERRRDLYQCFKIGLEESKFYTPNSDIQSKYRHVPFCLPVIISDNVKGDRKAIRDRAINLCNNLGIESRPVVSSNIGRHSCYRHLLNYWEYPIAEKLHNEAFYVGLHAKVKAEQIDKLTRELNKIC